MSPKIHDKSNANNIKFSAHMIVAMPTREQSTTLAISDKSLRLCARISEWRVGLKQQCQREGGKLQVASQTSRQGFVLVSADGE